MTESSNQKKSSISNAGHYCSVSRSTVANQEVTWLYLRAPIAKPLRVADPRSLPRGQIKTLPLDESLDFFQKTT
jgi:hypothetical protein